MVKPGQILSLSIEKPAVGGRMIARVDGQVVLVDGAVPGERVSARVEFVAKGVAYALVEAVEERSPDRRDPEGDRRCGGCLYAHIAYPRQLEIKSLVIADALVRIGRLRWSAPIAVAASPPLGYRMRARLHVQGGRIGFFREGTHEVCDVRPTGQLLDTTCDIVDRLAGLAARLPPGALRDVVIAENVDASQRVVQLEVAGGRPIGPLPGAIAGVTGVIVSSPDGALEIAAGTPFVTDTVAAGEPGAPAGSAPVRIRRHVRAFFQGNRYLLGSLVAEVLAQIPRGSRVIDLYAGGGLFSIAAAAARGADVVAVEGDYHAAQDLAANASAAEGRVAAVHQSVEAFVASLPARPDVVIVDPPRAGLSRQAAEGVLALKAARLVYVSCDVATLARDCRRLMDGGYRVARVEGFDLFPNTPHVEAVVTLDA